MADRERKFIGYFRLAEACEKPGCPVCRCVIEDGRRHLDALLYEQVNDPDTRRRLRSAWGLCNWHTWMLSTLATTRTGSAILYADLLRVAARRVDKLRDRRPARLMALLGVTAPPRPRVVERYRDRARCPVCLAAGAGEARHLDTAVEFAEDPQFARAYAKSAGLCVPHVLQAIERWPGRAELGRLLDRTIQKWAELRQQLADFVRKHEYRNTDPISEAEASACAAAFEMLTGAQGVFGNDLHSEQRGTMHREPPAESPAERNVAGERGANALAMKTIAELQRENAELRAALLARGGAPTDRAG